ncbi:flagellar basal body-associated FliL family protein [Undibacterium sp. Ren11W]|uniref:flagellar basal body-associated FliL family protein n=1 Tax=Undibacterium sp. Ren11W TaxID=3413045 RepID=UPI003BF0E8A6
MSKSPSKQDLLTSKLDFENIDGAEQTQKADVTAPQAVFKSGTESPVENKKSPTASQPSPKMDVKLKSTKPAEPEKKDRLTQTIAGLVLLGLIAVTGLIYMYKDSSRNVSGLNYVTLPQIIVNMDGNVARLQVSVQIDMEDADWLKQHKKELENSFQRTIAAMNPDDLRSAKGIAETQLALKQQLNEDARSEKIQAVLITELLVQGKE